MTRRLAAVVVVLTFALAAASVAQAGSVWFEGAVNQGHPVRPSTLWLSADGTLVVFHMHWSQWGGRVAIGKGNAEYHGCTPDCAQAPIHHAAVTVHLWGVRDCHGQDYYNRVTLYKRQGTLSVRFQHWAPC
jgi:hypothetical protein